jgi:hypothetical protein
MEAGNDLAILRRDRVALALLAVAAIVRLLFLAQVVALDLDLRPRINIDAYLYDRWGRRVAEGDWAMRHRYEFSGTHPDEPSAPRGSVAIAVLGLERHDREYGPRTYYDYPGYAYLVGACYAVFGVGSRVVLVLQEAFDLLACALVYLLARRLHSGTTVARIALALVALDGPLIFYAGFFLRDSLLASLTTTLVYLALSARSRRSWALLGLAFGFAWIVKGTFLLLVPFFATKLPRGRAALGPAGAFALGAGLAVSPFVARNVAFDVPPFRMTTLEVASILLYNAPNAGTRGLYLDLPGARSVADRCERLSASCALATAIRAHPSPLDWLSQSASRVASVGVADDAWDNVRYSWLAPRLSSLALARVRWKLLEPFALLGLVLALAQPWRNALVLAPVVMVLALAGVGVCLTRYRLPLEPMAALLAASAVVWLLREARAKRARAIYAALGCVAVSVALHDSVVPPSDERVAAYVRGTFPGAAAALLR